MEFELNFWQQFHGLKIKNCNATSHRKNLWASTTHYKNLRIVSHCAFLQHKIFLVFSQYLISNNSNAHFFLRSMMSRPSLQIKRCMVISYICLTVVEEMVIWNVKLFLNKFIYIFFIPYISYVNIYKTIVTIISYAQEHFINNNKA